MFDNQSILITGGTGSFGQKFVETLLREHSPRRIIVFSRDELKQHEMRQRFPDDSGPMRYFIGDVRDRDRLHRAFNDVDIVVHAAALKQVVACESNPIEAVLTNVMGSRNIIEATIDAGVKKVMAISTDKAVSPVNLYGATKLVAEKLMVQANSYRGRGDIRFSCVRYGNVVASRGSVIPLFMEQRKSGRVTITDPRMTRFWLTVDDAVQFVIRCLDRMDGGEVFIPKIPSMALMDLVEALAPSCEVTQIGIRPGEKLHELLISTDEARHTVEREDMYVIQPAHPWWDPDIKYGDTLPDGFQYSSDTNVEKLQPEQLRRLSALHTGDAVE